LQWTLAPLDKQDALLEPNNQPRGNARVILSGMEEPRAEVIESDDAPSNGASRFRLVNQFDAEIQESDTPG
jgi:hypothetical protein